jgi:EmrB/QacA subfamily drug resistance transporter
MAFIDATVVTVALPSIGADLNAGMAGLQWVVNAYTLTLASFILLGGSLGDRYGRRRIFLIGVVWFAVASLLCGVAPDINTLVAARALQGVGGALLTPGSLALIQASFERTDRARAIGAWSGLGAIAGALGPFLGGWLVEVATWRLVFFINVPVAAAVVFISQRWVPESVDPRASRSLDLAGSAYGALGLAGVTYGFIAANEPGTNGSVVIAAFGAGIAAMAAFVVRERRTPHPMLPLDIFSSRQFTGANLVTLAVYGAFGGLFFFLVLVLQVVAGFSPVAAGLALLPITLVMLLLSPRAGALSQRIGPRLPMTVGPIVCAGGVLLLSRIGPDASYATDVLPGVLLFGLGLSITVAPLTATVLAAAPERHAGIASGVNNAVARAAGLIAVAALPLLVGLTGDAYADPAALSGASSDAMMICAAILAAGGLTALATISNEGIPQEAEEAACRRNCAVAAPPLSPEPEHAGRA